MAVFVFCLALGSMVFCGFVVCCGVYGSWNDENVVTNTIFVTEEEDGFLILTSHVCKSIISVNSRQLATSLGSELYLAADKLSFPLATRYGTVSCIGSIL